MEKRIILVLRRKNIIDKFQALKDTNEYMNDTDLCRNAIECLYEKIINKKND